MMEEIRIITEGGENEIEEKKSRFIATIRSVQDEQEALDLIASMKKKYWNATHNCFAYIVGERGQLKRCSDDGEPQGTAGRPMLSVLEGEHLTNVIAVVTRYFGGTLLGTGGLVRAYGRAVTEGLKSCRIMTRRDGFRLGIRTNYTDLGKLQYLLGQRGMQILESEYGEDVKTWILVPEEDFDALTAVITEQTGGRAVYFEKEPLRFAVGGGEQVIL